MKVINAKEAQNNSDNLMNSAIKVLVVINKYGKPFSILISYEAYEYLSKLEDFYGAVQAKQAKKNGMLTQKKTEEFLSKILEE